MNVAATPTSTTVALTRTVQTADEEEGENVPPRPPVPRHFILAPLATPDDIYDEIYDEEEREGAGNAR